MTPEAAHAMYLRQIDAHGEEVTFHRLGSPNVDETIRARVIGYRPDELVGAVQQGDVRIIALAEDVETSSFPTPFRERFDKAIIRGKETTIQAVDDNTRRVAGILIAYDIRVRG